jgi:hypothetical protein
MRMRLLDFVRCAGLGTAMAQSASAADMSLPPVYRAPPPAYFTWTGWYSVSMAAAAGARPATPPLSASLARHR